jgi:hypothetical protein
MQEAASRQGSKLARVIKFITEWDERLSAYETAEEKGLIKKGNYRRNIMKVELRAKMLHKAKPIEESLAHPCRWTISNADILKIRTCLAALCIRATALL